MQHRQSPQLDRPRARARPESGAPGAFGRHVRGAGSRRQRNLPLLVRGAAVTPGARDGGAGGAGGARTGKDERRRGAHVAEEGGGGRAGLAKVLCDRHRSLHSSSPAAHTGASTGGADVRSAARAHRPAGPGAAAHGTRPRAAPPARARPPRPAAACRRTRLRRAGPGECSWEKPCPPREKAFFRMKKEERIRGFPSWRWAGAPSGPGAACSGMEEPGEAAVAAARLLQVCAWCMRETGACRAHALRRGGPGRGWGDGPKGARRPCRGGAPCVAGARRGGRG